MGGQQDVPPPETHTSRPSSVPRRLAFTLVEIMVALAIFSIVVAAIYSTWLLVMRSSQVGQETANRTQRQRIALRTIEDSLRCIQSFQASMKYYYFVVVNGDQPQLSFTARLPDVFPRNSRFGGVNLRRLTFSLESGKDSEHDLVLRQNPVLMDLDPVEQQTPLILARDVKTFTVECWDPNQGQYVTEWDDTNSIPIKVRITIGLDDNNSSYEQAPELAITRVIGVPSMTVPSGLQGNAFGVGAAPPGGGGGSFNNGGIQLPRP
jgi:type II secretion system protein J